MCVEGESGLLSVLHRYGFVKITARPPAGLEYTWNRSLGELVLGNGSRFDTYTSEKPDTLRGPQHHVAWCDEVAAWIQADDTWDQLEFGLRLGDRPRWYATTTPRPRKVVRQLLLDAAKVSRGAMYDNIAHLAPTFVARMRAKYEGTRLGRQELHAELLEDTPGALWTRVQLDADRVPFLTSTMVPTGPGGRLRNVVVGVDPSDANGEGDEFGICVAGLGWDHELYVVDSQGLQDGPVESLRAAVRLAREWAGRIVIEKNHGSAYLVATLEQVLREEGVRVPYEAVNASDGKRTRAEPVAALYEQHKVHHVGLFADLEDQLTSFDGSGKSPDRLDALVWALTPFLGYSLQPPVEDRFLAAVPWADSHDPLAAAAWT